MIFFLKEKLFDDDDVFILTNFIMMMMILALLNFKGQPEKKKQLFSPFLFIKKKS